jgi:hypothetical protein
MRLRIVLLSDVAVGVGSGGVEIAQRDRPQAMRVTEIGQDSLHDELGKPVRINRTLRLLRYSSRIGTFSGTP